MPPGGLTQVCFYAHRIFHGCSKDAFLNSDLLIFFLLLLQVSTQQAEMDSKFIAMKRTIALLEKYDQKLPEMTEKFYTAAPQRCVPYIS